jgi:O-acetyl-ADP-ribose deacetylase (regulator of RNase III)
MITFTQGDLFTCGIRAIAHGVNCQGVMGAGIAAEFRRRWPQMYEAYRKRCESGGLWAGDVLPWEHAGGVVFNLATQPVPGPSAQPWMITAAVGRMIQLAGYGYEIRQVAMPWIGCGLGGLGPGHLRAALRPYEDAPVDLVVIEYKAPGP